MVSTIHHRHNASVLLYSSFTDQQPFVTPFYIHVDMETLDALAAALKSFEGAVVVISHNQSFLSGFCNELWVVDNGRVDVRHDDSFSDMFAQYKLEAAAGAANRRSTRTAKARMARKANQQRIGGIERTGFI